MLEWIIVAAPIVIAFGCALVFFVRDRDEEPVAHMESKRRRTRDD